MLYFLFKRTVLKLGNICDHVDSYVSTKYNFDKYLKSFYIGGNEFEWIEFVVGRLPQFSILTSSFNINLAVVWIQRPIMRLRCVVVSEGHNETTNPCVFSVSCCTQYPWRRFRLRAKLKHIGNYPFFTEGVMVPLPIGVQSITSNIAYRVLQIKLHTLEWHTSLMK